MSRVLGGLRYDSCLYKGYDSLNVSLKQKSTNIVSYSSYEKKILTGLKMLVFSLDIM